MSEERITRWFAVDADGRVIARFTRENDADSYVAMTTLRVVKLMEVRHTESIVDTAELSALREKAEGPIVEAPRPFKVGDRVGTTYADKGTVILAVKWDEDGEVCEPNWHKLKLLAPAPAPEATAAPGEPLRVQMVPVSLLDEVVKNRDEWKARAENAEAQCRSVERWHQSLVIDERARFERECAMRLLAALVTRGAPHIGQKETEPLLSLAKQMADHYLPAKEQTMTESDRLIDEVLRLDESATKGPWTYATWPTTFDGRQSPSIIAHGGYGVLACDGPENGPNASDANAIASYRSAAPRLARMLRVALDRLRKNYETIGASGDGNALTEVEKIAKGEA